MAKAQKYFDSLKSAAAATGISIELLKKAKDQGCPGFRGSRVYAKEVKAWITQNAPSRPPEPSFRESKIHEEWRRLKIRNDKDEGKLVPIAMVADRIREVCARQLAILRQKLENEYPSAAAGLEPPQLRVYGKRLVDDICDQMQALSKLFDGLAQKAALTGTGQVIEPVTRSTPAAVGEA